MSSDEQPGFGRAGPVGAGMAACMRHVQEMEARLGARAGRPKTVRGVVKYVVRAVEKTF